jgi:MtrB/PioB family decaheme-associated outer membrane protein
MDKFTHIGVGLTALLLAANLHAQSDEAPASWRCESCSVAEGWDIDLEIGGAYSNEDSFEFGDYTGLDDDGGYLFGDVLALYRDNEGKYVNLEGFAYSADSLAFFLEGGQQGNYELRASYQAIPRRIFSDTLTPYLGNGGANLSLPATWVRAPNTAGMTAFASTASPVSIEWDWDVYGFGADYKPATNWDVRADYTHTEKEGQRRSSGSFGFSAAEFARPVDYTSDDLELEVAYGADWWQTSLSYYGSVFSNDDESLTWDNAYTSGVGTDEGEMALAPDNESHQVSLAGSMILPLRTTLNGQLGFGHMTQNEDLLPYTTNPGLGAGALPTDSANAEVDTWNMNLRAVTSPWRKVTLEGEFRYKDFNNKTPINQYTYINSDVGPGGTVSNTAYDYESRDISVRGEYRMTSALKFNAGFDNERVVRNKQDRTRTTNDRLWAGLRSRIGSSINLSAEAFIEDRGGSDYEVRVNPESQQNPLMRKYNMADRERYGFKANTSTFMAGGTSINFEFEYSDDDYDKSDIGLTESDYLRFGTDLSAPIGEASSIYASFYEEHIETDQANSQSFSTADWRATTDDRFQTATAGVIWPDIIGRIDATFEYAWSQSVGEVNSNTSGLPDSFPDLRTKRQTVRAGLNYPYSKSLSFGFNYLFESLDSDDWSLDNVEPDTMNNLLALGADPWNYNASVFYLSVRYQLSAN